MATKKTKTGSGKKLGMVGLRHHRTDVQEPRSRAFQQGGGVVGIQVLKDKIVLRVVSDEVAAKPSQVVRASFRSRPSSPARFPSKR